MKFLRKLFYSFVFGFVLFGFSQNTYADVLTYIPTTDGVSFGYGSALSRINDGNISTSGSSDYQVHPTNAVGKTITMTFNDLVNISNVEFYNRIGCCTNRIGSAQMIFKDEAGVEIYTYTFAGGNNPALVTVANPLGDILNVKSVELTNFQQNNQNFREIIFNGEVILASTLRITELEYDTVQGGNDGSYEWIELYNYGAADIDLENWTLTDANPTTVTLPSFIVPAGAQIVLANNPTNFQVNYPTVTADIDLSPTLGLSNSGDTITLRSPGGDDIDFVAWEGASVGWDLATTPDSGESICRTDSDTDTDGPGDFIVCSSPSPQSDDTTPPLTPSIPDLTTDSGGNTTDNITNSETPSFDVVCSEDTSIITLYENTTELETVACITAGTRSITSPILSDGVHLITYTETDQFNNESNTSPALAVTVDTVAPTITAFSADTDGAFSVDMPNLDFMALDVGGSGVFQYEISIDGGAFSVQTSPYNPTIPVAASHTVIVRSTDIAGNQSTSTIQFPPVVSINSPTTLSNTVITDGAITVTGPNDIISVLVSANASNVSCGVLPQTAPVTCTFQVDSTGTVTATAEDTSGATGFITRDYIIDSIFPVISFNDDVEMGPVASDTVVVNVSEVNFMDLYDYGFSSDSACDNTDIFTETFSSREVLIFEDETNNGDYLCFRAIDTFGNVSYLSSSEVLSIDITAPDAPIITSTKNPITGTGDVGDIIEVVTDSGATCTVSVQPGNTWECTLLPDPVPGENYSAVATDFLGNISDQAFGTIFKKEEPISKGGSKRVSQEKLDVIFGTQEPAIEINLPVIEGACSSTILFTENMRQGDIDGKYSSWERDTITEVKKLQTYMNGQNYRSGPVDGVFGSLTGAATKRMQKQLGTFQDGQIGPLTRALLNSECDTEESPTLFELVMKFLTN